MLSIIRVGDLTAATLNLRKFPQSVRYKDQAWFASSD